MIRRSGSVVVLLRCDVVVTSASAGSRLTRGGFSLQKGRALVWRYGKKQRENCARGAEGVAAVKSKCGEDPEKFNIQVGLTWTCGNRQEKLSMSIFLQAA